MKYAVLRLEGDVFVHLMDIEPGSDKALVGLDAFKAFQAGTATGTWRHRTEARRRWLATSACSASERHMIDSTAGSDLFAATFGPRLGTLRPKLHRYCARMTGSIIDGEDVLQDALAKAMLALPATGPIANPEGWLFRIVHNTALDFLRRRARRADALEKRRQR